MDKRRLKRLLAGVKKGTVSVEAALAELALLPYQDLGFARIDTHRSFRRGFPEVIYCPGKAEKQILAIAERLRRGGSLVLATRATEKIYRAMKKKWPVACYHREARMVSVGKPQRGESSGGTILVVTAGTSDIPVAEEARVTAVMMGNKVEKLYDVGIAGIHRLLDEAELVRKANVLIVVAGMEGALAGVVGGIVKRPVIAVPTSVGYGASFQGLAPLLTMLNSCAAGVGVVNIDNGFGAGYLASLINQRL